MCLYIYIYGYAQLMTFISAALKYVYDVLSELLKKKKHKTL